MPGREFVATSLTLTVIESLKDAIKLLKPFAEMRGGALAQAKIECYESLLKNIETSNLDVSLKSRDE